MSAAATATASGVTVTVGTVSDPGFEGLPGLNQEIFDAGTAFREALTHAQKTKDLRKVMQASEHLAGLELGALPDRALEVEKVVEEHGLAGANAGHTLAQKQTIAAKPPAFRDDHALCPALGDLDLGGDGVGLVQDARRRAGRHAGQFARIGEDRASRRDARTRRIPARERRVVEWKHVVLLRFGIEEGLQILDLLRHLRSEIVVLGGVLLNVVELPLVPADDVRRRRAAQLPRQGHRRCRRHPAIMIDGTIAQHPEVLRRVFGLSVRVYLVPPLPHAHALRRALA